MMTAKIHARDPMEEIAKAFRMFDDDASGSITFKDVKRVIKELGEPITDEEVEQMIDEADRNGDGEVDLEEFARVMRKTTLFL